MKQQPDLIPHPPRTSPLPFFLAALLVLGVAAIVLVNALRLNFPAIRSDGLGYYLYLPATFLYRDLGLHSVADFFSSGSTPGAYPALWHYSGPALWQETGQYLIKYPAGVAILMLPFFLVACLLSLAGALPLDGFSPLFQYLIALSGLCYAAAGVVVLWKVLERRFRQETVLLAMCAIVFGTDLFHYASYDSVFSHAYSFFLFAASLYLTERVYSAPRLKTILATGGVAGLIVVTRPTNALWLVFPLLYGVTSAAAFRERVSFWKTHAAALAGAASLCCAIVFLQLCYWKAVTGHFLVFSYQGEGFNFADPQLFNVLFSVRKGLFFWAPILLTVFPGLYCLRRKAPEYLLPALIFLPLNLYVISSWHSWFYGGSFGHRAFIESFPLFAACFCALWEASSGAARRALFGCTAASILLSLWLMLKYWTGVIPFDGTTWDYFAATFFMLRP